MKNDNPFGGTTLDKVVAQEITHGVGIGHNYGLDQEDVMVYLMH